MPLLATNYDGFLSGMTLFVLWMVAAALAVIASIVFFRQQSYLRGRRLATICLGISGVMFVPVFFVIRHEMSRSEVFFITTPILILGFTFAPAALALIVRFSSRGESPAPTKPVEPTGTSSSPSDLTTSHTSGDSPGGSLRR